MSTRDETITVTGGLLSVPAANAAHNAGLKTWGDLADRYRLDRCQRMRNVGPKIREQFRTALADLGLLDVPVDVRDAAVFDEARNNPGGFAVYVDKGGGP